MRLGAPDLDLLRVRVAVSPMLTVQASLFEVIGGQDRGADERWRQVIRERAQGLDLAALQVFAPPNRTTPNWMVPDLRGGEARFDEELARVAATPPDRVIGELRDEFPDGLPSVFDPYAADPAGALAGYCAALERYWRGVVAPSWPRLRASLSSEALRVAWSLARHGTAATLAGVHPRLVRSDGGLAWSGPRRQEHGVGDRPIVLAPMASGTDALFYSVDRPDAVVVGYGAPGAAELFADLEPPAGGDLVQLLGPARAGLLLRLEGPATTHALARVLGYAPSTVSEHLSALQGMGLVGSSRVGRYVHYSRTERGDLLLGLYSG